jgi:hypothetical protein
MKTKQIAPISLPVHLETRSLNQASDTALRFLDLISSNHHYNREVRDTRKGNEEKAYPLFEHGFAPSLHIF